MNAISTRTHGYLDYGLGVVLILGPLIFGFGGDGTASWVLIIAGVLLIGLSLMTRYELGAIKAVPMPVHLGMDAVLGLVLIASPWLFGFADAIWWPHVLVGLLEIGTAAMTERRPGFETSRTTG